MTCHQCQKPAMYLIGEEKIPLCLDCYLKTMQAAAIQNEMLQREINYLTDAMHYTVGLPPMGPHYPEKSVLNIGGTILTNIKIDNSNIGVLNTGTIQAVDFAVTALMKSGDEKLAEAFKNLTEAVVKNAALQEKQKNDLLDILSLLSAEATVSKEKRRQGAIKPLIEKVKTYFDIAKDLSDLWHIWGPVVLRAFGIDS